MTTNDPVTEAGRTLLDVISGMDPQGLYPPDPLDLILAIEREAARDQEDTLGGDMEDLDYYAKQLTEKLQYIAETRPEMPAVTQHVLANDLVSADLADAALEVGKTWLEASEFVGSFARMDWWLKHVAAGTIPQREMIRRLPDLWISSDPDDTDPRYLHLWMRAKAYNAGNIVCDGSPAPRGKFNLLKVYRGVPFGGEVGLSWTHKWKVAKKFALGAESRIWRKRGEVIEGIANRGDVLAYLTGRSEFEIIVDPSKVEVVKRWDVRLA